MQTESIWHIVHLDVFAGIVLLVFSIDLALNESQAIIQSRSYMFSYAYVNLRA